MDLKALRYFVSVAEKLSFTEAALDHYVAQSAISKQIARLEDQVGVPLLSRNRRTVQLTAAGRYLLEEARHLIDSYEKAMNKTRLIGNGLNDSLTIGFLGHEKAFLPQFIKQFTHQNAGVNIELKQLKRDSLNHALENGTVDVGFTLSLSIEKFPNITWEQISKIPFNLVVSIDHPLASQETTKLSTLKNEPLVVINPNVSPDSFQHINKVFEKWGLSPNIVKYGSDFETVLLMVEAGIGAAFLPKTISNSPAGIRFIQLEDPIPETQFIIAWRAQNSNPLIPLFTKSFQSFFQASRV